MKIAVGSLISWVLQDNGSKCVMLASQQQSLSGLVEMENWKTSHLLNAKQHLIPRGQEIEVKSLIQREPLGHFQRSH